MVDVTRADGVRRPVTGTTWRTRAARHAFWNFAWIGILVLSAGWIWYGMAFEEEQSEQGKALSAGMTMAGTGMLLGGIPLILLHVIGLAILVTIAVRNRHPRWTGVLLAVVCVAVASLIGIAAGQLLYSGRLFEMSADHPVPFVP